MRNVLELEVGYIKIYAVILYKSMLSNTPMPESKPTKSNNTSQTSTTTNNNNVSAIISSQNPSTPPSISLSKTRSVPPTKKQPSQLEKNLQEIKDLENVIQNFENKIPSFKDYIRNSLHNQKKFAFTKKIKNQIIEDYMDVSSPTDYKELIGQPDTTIVDDRKPNKSRKYVIRVEYDNMLAKLNKLDTEVTTDLSELSEKPILYGHTYPELFPIIQTDPFKYAVQLDVDEPIYILPNESTKYDYLKEINELNAIKRNVKSLKERVKALKESVNTIKRGGKQKTRKHRVRHTKHKRRSTKRDSSTKTRK